MSGAALLEQQVSCPFCAERLVILVDLSAGGQSYVEDCQVCCQPMQVSFEADADGLAWIRIERAQ